MPVKSHLISYTYKEIKQKQQQMQKIKIKIIIIKKSNSLTLGGTKGGASLCMLARCFLMFPWDWNRMGQQSHG
jgi:hypothetical protein